MAEFGGIEEIEWYTPERVGELREHLDAHEEPLFGVAGTVADLDSMFEVKTVGSGALVLTPNRLVGHTHKRAGMFGGKGTKPNFTDYDLVWIENSARSKSDATVVRLLFRTDGVVPYNRKGVQVSVSSVSVRDEALPYFADMLKPLVSAHRGYA